MRRCATSALFWRYLIDFGNEFHVRGEVHRPVLNHGAGGVLPEIIVAPPVYRRTDRPRRKSASAIGAYVFEDTIHALRAERAFVGADACLARFRGQGSIAVLTGWSQLKHRATFYATSLSILANVLRHSQILKLAASCLLPVTINLSASLAWASVV